MMHPGQNGFGRQGGGTCFRARGRCSSSDLCRRDPRNAQLSQAVEQVHSTHEARPEGVPSREDVEGAGTQRFLPQESQGGRDFGVPPLLAKDGERSVFFVPRATTRQSRFCVSGNVLSGIEFLHHRTVEMCTRGAKLMKGKKDMPLSSTSLP